LKKEELVFLDQTACQNISNVSRNLYLPGHKNKINKNPLKIKTKCNRISKA
jgi:hypothetical protein